ncbi:hypothetical protein [Frigoriglobus tundricola]|uniref:Uncharacterized protein n=1 Tax=Frigoriglobus tundricola TaxID=2774151 RepID=A0A6M5YKQ5_9BACT|nr:hypothetical protein [Frigoriglobus tundricola]QJW93866.1 hypothetical protein FTUN_1380 [Frigoriglobus tundricola]
MYVPDGLQYWEIVAASGLCALGFLSVATVVSATVAVFATREPAPVRAPAAAPAAPASEARQPAYAA